MGRNFGIDNHEIGQEATQSVTHRFSSAKNGTLAVDGSTCM